MLIRKILYTKKCVDEIMHIRKFALTKKWMDEKMRWRNNAYTKICVDEKMNGRKNARRKFWTYEKCATKKWRDEKMPIRKSADEKMHTKKCATKKRHGTRLRSCGESCNGSKQGFSRDSARIQQGSMAPSICPKFSGYVQQVKPVRKSLWQNPGHPIGKP